METEIFRQLASTGVVGIMLVLTVIELRSERKALKQAYKEKDEAIKELQKRLEEEMQARIEDAKVKDARIELKDARIQEETDARIGDSNRLHEIVLKIQQETTENVSTLSRVTHEVSRVTHEFTRITSEFMSLSELLRGMLVRAQKKEEAT